MKSLPFFFPPLPQQQTIGNESMAGMEDVLADPETEEVLAEFDFLVSESGEGAGEARSQGDGTEWGKYYLKRRKIKDKKKH